MLHKFLLPTALFLSITAITATTARAADIDVPFTGNVAAACEFAKPDGGVLTANNSILPTQLSSKNKKGQSGVVTVKCNTPATIYVRDYKQTSGQEIEAKATYTVSNGKEEETKVSVGVGETSIQVNLTLDSDQPIPAGDYSYNVMITATP